MPLPQEKSLEYTSNIATSCRSSPCRLCRCSCSPSKMLMVAMSRTHIRFRTSHIHIPTLVCGESHFDIIHVNANGDPDYESEDPTRCSRVESVICLQCGWEYRGNAGALF